MTKRIVSLGGSLLVCLALTSAQAPALAEKVMSGAVCSTRVHDLTSDIDWQKSLDKALARAGEEGKLVVWVHMLGKIDGAT